MKIWEPLVRLCYLCYLVHPIIMALYLFNLKQTVYYHEWKSVSDHIGQNSSAGFQAARAAKRRVSEAAYLSHGAMVVAVVDIIVVIIAVVDQWEEDSSAFSKSAQTPQT